jgi:hypothetical protein
MPVGIFRLDAAGGPKRGGERLLFGFERGRGERCFFGGWLNRGVLLLDRSLAVHAGR